MPATRPAYDNWMDERHIRRLTGKATRGTETVPFVGKVAGGGSAVNGAMFIRGVPEDYDLWAAAGNDLWSFEHCLRYFRKLETDLDFGASDYHGSNGPIIARRPKPAEWLADQKAFYNACRAAGFPDSPDQNHPDATGVGAMAFNNPDGIRLSTAIGYLNPARHRLNLTIRSGCTARRIIFDGKKAIGLEVESGGESFTVEGEEIILSAGAVFSPQLLMLSGVGPQEHLRAFGISPSCTISRASVRTCATIPTVSSICAPERAIRSMRAAPGSRLRCATPPPDQVSKRYPDDDDLGDPSVLHRRPGDRRLAFPSAPPCICR